MFYKQQAIYLLRSDVYVLTLAGDPRSVIPIKVPDPMTAGRMNLMVRPEDIHIDKVRGDLPATICQKLFLGDAILYMVDAGKTRLRVRTGAQENFEPKELVYLTLEQAHAYTFMDPVAYIEQFDPQRILHVHFSDSSDSSIHAPLGTGKTDIHAALTALDKKFDGLAIIEGYVPGRGDETVSNNATFLKKLDWL